MSDPQKAPAPPAPAPRARDPRAVDERRKFLRAAAVGVGVVGCSMVGLVPVLGDGRKRLRPPGALDEHDFLAACIKCGQCVQVCPVEALKPADIFDGFGVGVPYIDARNQACDFACDVGQCILACPTGALAYHKPDFFPVRPGAALASAPVLLAKAKDPEPTMQFKERLGLAVLERPGMCLSVLGHSVKGPARGDAFKGKHRYPEVDRWTPVRVNEHPYDLDTCDLCVRECPIQGAITLEPVVGHDGATRMTPTVHEPCVGCGVCEMMCPAEPAAIVVKPRQTWEGA